MTKSKSAAIGLSGVYAVAIIFSCILINGALSRSARSADRHDNNGTHGGRCDAVKAFFENKNVSVDFGALQHAAAGTDNSEYTKSSA